jgi:hypothetical protein
VLLNGTNSTWVAYIADITTRKKAEGSYNSIRGKNNILERITEALYPLIPGAILI